MEVIMKDIHENEIKVGMKVEKLFTNGNPHLRGIVVLNEKGLYKGLCIQITEIWDKSILSNYKDNNRRPGGWKKVSRCDPHIMSECYLYKISY